MSRLRGPVPLTSPTHASHLFVTPLIVATALSCKDLAQAGGGRFQPIRMPTQIQKRVDHTAVSESPRCW